MKKTEAIMEILAAYGTGEQKKRWLEPLLNQEIFSAYSMTEPQGGSEPKLFKTHAGRHGDPWIITPDEGQARLLQDVKNWAEYVRIAKIEPQG